MALVAAVSAVLAWRASSFWSGDYPVDAGPVIDKLVNGDINGFLSGRPLMGPLSLLLRSPFAALAKITGGGGPGDLYDNAYRFGVFPCALAGGLLGVVLHRRAQRNGTAPLAAYAALILCMLNPVSLKAIEYGHPEEILGAALATGAMLAAIDRRGWLTAILLALTVATKQWGMLAIASILVVAPWREMRKPVAVAALLGALVAVPVVAIEPGTFLRLNAHLLDVRSGNVGPGSIWWLFTRPLAGAAGVHHTPGWLGLVARPAIIALSVIVPLALSARVRERPLERALPLLALVMLLRAVLDPVDNSYYHVPFLIALVAADALVGSVLASLTAAAWLIAVIDLSGHPGPQGVVYALSATATIVYLAGRAYGLDWQTLLRSRVVRGPGVAQQVR